MSDEATLEYARRRDDEDELRAFRHRFAFPRDDQGRAHLYLCGHSLGLQPRGARELVVEELDDWARLGVRGHEHARRPWIHYHENLAEGLAQLAGAQPSEVVAMSSLTVNLHLMMASFYRPEGRRTRILMEHGSFPSDRHAVASQIAWHGMDPASTLVELAPAAGEDLVREDAVEAYLAQSGSEVALVLWPGVQYRTGQAFDLERIARAAHKAGCLVGFDLAHAIGNLPLAMHDHDADFAVWCSYKYLNAGPGAIGGCFIHERHANPEFKPRLAGWWGHEIATRFRMEAAFVPETGAPGWQISNPPILSAAPLIASLALFQEAGMARLRAKSVALTRYLARLLERFSGRVQLVTPTAPESRGCQLSMRITGGDGKQVFERLTAQGVLCDWREPDIIRVAPVPLYNSFEDVYAFSERLAQALRGGH